MNNKDICCVCRTEFDESELTVCDICKKQVCFGCGRTNEKKFFCDDCIEERA